MFINSEKIVSYELPETSTIFDCQFHPSKDNLIGFATIDGDVKMFDFDFLDRFGFSNIFIFVVLFLMMKLVKLCIISKDIIREHQFDD